MKLIFLHGLGQNEQSWQAVVEQLPQYSCEMFNCFAQVGDALVTRESLTQSLQDFLEQQEEPFVLVGLSLGSLLALSLPIQKLPNLRGMVLASAQYQLKDSFMFKVQYAIFSLLPQKVFNFGLTKAQTLSLLKSNLSLDLTEQLAQIHVPIHFICGAKDAFNLKASRALSQLLPQATYAEIPNGKHELNRQTPGAFAHEIQNFMEKLAF
ncbi:MAG: alpha/beta hydrolase [Aerococcaceae bacterium]|nr:alpha/beta hydrolase [Aerococcaceae bacterium]